MTFKKAVDGFVGITFVILMPVILLSFVALALYLIGIGVGIMVKGALLVLGT